MSKGICKIEFKNPNLKIEFEVTGYQFFDYCGDSQYNYLLITEHDLADTVLHLLDGFINNLRCECEITIECEGQVMIKRLAFGKFRHNLVNLHFENDFNYNSLKPLI